MDLYDILKFVGKPLLKFPFHYNTKVEGKENLPQGKAIIAANHISYLDPIFICTYLKKKTHFFTKTECFGLPFCGWFLKAIKQIEIEEDKISKKNLEEALQVLQKNEYFGIFPEGTRSYDGKLQKARKGVALIARLSSAPIVPIAIKGTYDIYPRKANFPKLYSNVLIKIGKPIFSKDYEKKDKNELTNLVMQKIARLYS